MKPLLHVHKCFSLAVLVFMLVSWPLTESYAAQNAKTERHWGESVQLKGVENLYKISDELYRSAQPDKEGMSNLDAYGICTIINLRGFHSDRDKVLGTDLALVEIPIHAWNSGDDELVLEVLQAIRNAKKPVLIHCEHGADRSGLVTAMYRIVEQGWSKEDALKEMQDGPYGFHAIWQNIVNYIEETDIDNLRSQLK